MAKGHQRTGLSLVIAAADVDQCLRTFRRAALCRCASSSSSASPSLNSPARVVVWSKRVVANLEHGQTKRSTITGLLCGRWRAITKDRIVGHSDIAPGRKTDPGPAFDFYILMTYTTIWAGLLFLFGELMTLIIILVALGLDYVFGGLERARGAGWFIRAKAGIQERAGRDLPRAGNTACALCRLGWQPGIAGAFIDSAFAVLSGILSEP